jgi:hypothetical protein
VDVSTLSNPFLVKSYPMEGPYGLGVRNQMLFVCDGESGLRVYDKSDIENLVELRHITGIVTYDVIPLEESLLVVGDDNLHQYDYLEDDIQWISTLELH